jgi:hypothetical protein
MARDYYYDNKGNKLGFRESQDGKGDFGIVLLMLAIILIGFLLSPLLAAGVWVFVELKTVGFHDVFAAIGGVGLFALGLFLLWRYVLFRYSYFGGLTLLVAVLAYMAAPDAVWGGFWFLAIAAVGGGLTFATCGRGED